MRKTTVMIWALVMMAGISVFSAVGQSTVVDNTATVMTARAVSNASVAVDPVNDTPPRAAYKKLPFVFVPNAGQMDANVQYSGWGPGYGVFFTQKEAVFTFMRQTPQDHRRKPLHARPVAFSPAEIETQGVVLALRFIGANPSVKPQGNRQETGKVNYLIGKDPAKWHTGLPTYREVVYRELWPGVDLVFRTANGQLKYELLVQPEASIETIRLAYSGAEGLSLDAAGNLLIHTPHGVLTDVSPQSYQEIDGRRVPVASRFVLAAETAGENGYGFAIGSEYDSRYPLMIDPGLVYSTFLGGSGDDAGYGIDVDGAGNAYVTGQTQSRNFPDTVGAFDRKIGGSIDAFVTKFNTNGDLVYSTFVGGGGPESGYGIAVDGAGNAHVTGVTLSANFPTTVGAFDASNNGSDDAFVIKLDASGSTLLYSTFLGGSGIDIAYDIALDGGGNAYVTGETDSSEFPTPTGTVVATGIDAFVVKLNDAGSTLEYTTLLGSSGTDRGNGIAVDILDNAYVIGDDDLNAFVTRLDAAGVEVYTTLLGGTGTNMGNDIVVDGLGEAYATGDNGLEAFVIKLDTSGVEVYTTLLGGSGFGSGRGIDLDADGFVYVVGETQPAGSGTDVFLVKLDPEDGSTVFSTLLGGSFDDFGTAIAVTGDRHASITGYTLSADFPTAAPATSPGPFDASHNGGTDAFVARFDTNQAPGAADDDATTDEDTPVTIDVTTNDNDADGNLEPTTANTDCDTCSVPGHGTLVNNGDGSFTYTPDPDYNGPDGFTYEICDIDDACSTATVTITVNPVNDAPVSVADSATTNEDTYVDIDVIANDTDVDHPNADLQVLIGSIANVLGGTAELQPDRRTVRFTPDQNANSVNTAGGFSFRYQTTDATLASITPATVTITVDPVNDAPRVDEPLADVVVQEDADPTVIDLSGTFVEVDGDAVTLSVGNTNPALVTATLSGNTLTLNYLADQNGTATVTVTATDTAESSESDSFLVTVNAVNDAPRVANPIDDVQVSEDAASTEINLSTTFIEVDGETLTLSVTENTNPTLVNTTLITNTLTLDYVADQNGTATVTVTATDTTGLSVQDSFGITVTAVNDAPVVLSPIGNLLVAVDENETVLPLATTFADADGEPLTLTVEATPAGLVIPALSEPTLTASTTLTLTYPADQSGVATIVVRATDTAGTVVEDTFKTCLDRTADTRDDDFDRIPNGCDTDVDNDTVTDKESFEGNFTPIPVSTGGDNCPGTIRIRRGIEFIGFNPDQADLDGDGIGDACDNCPAVFNPDQADSDGNAEPGVGGGDACQTDTIPESERPQTNNGPTEDPALTDTDSDGLTDDQEATLGTDPNNADTDLDTIDDGPDNCPLTANADQTDTDDDGAGDACDDDDDNDGALDTADNCPLTANADQADLDGDGFGDVCDADADGDGFEPTAVIDPDCNDLDAAVNPGVAEIPGNAIDDDCDPNTPDTDPEMVLTLSDPSDPTADHDTWLPTDGREAIISATVAGSAGPVSPQPAVTFTVLSVTAFPGKYTNDANVADMSDDYVTAPPVGNQISITSQDYGGSITIEAQATLADGTVLVKTITVPKDSDGDGLPDAFESLYGDLVPGEDIDTSNDNTFIGDGLTNTKEYRGFIWGPALVQVAPAAADAGGLYQTPAYVPGGGAAEHFRGNPTRKDLFVTFVNFDSPGYDAPCDCPFAVGTAFHDDAGIDVHVVNAATVPAPGELNINVMQVTNDLVDPFGFGDGHINKRGIRDWSWDTKGASGIGDGFVYGSPVMYQVSLDGYFDDRTYTDSGGNGVLDPLTLVEDVNDNAIIDGKGPSIEDTNGNGSLDGDLVVIGSYVQALSAFDIDNDGHVEHPLASDPATIDPQFESTRAQVLKHTITHEMCHAMGCQHTTDDSDLMYEFTNSWIRDGNLSSAAKGLIQIHNN